MCSASVSIGCSNSTGPFSRHFEGTFSSNTYIHVAVLYSCSNHGTIEMLQWFAFGERSHLQFLLQWGHISCNAEITRRPDLQELAPLEAGTVQATSA